MTNKDKGQFLAEIKMIGLQKEFKGLFGEQINPVNLVKEVDKVLDTRKTSYNYAFVKCCEKNGIKKIDNIYNDLEKLWSDYKHEFGVIVDGLLPLVFGGVRNLFIHGLSKYQKRISKKWNHYIQKTVEYAETLDDIEENN